MTNRALLYLFIALVCSFGCTPAPRRCILPTGDTNPSLQSSKSASVDVFLDGTLSMKGFIVPGISSRYQQTLPLLESVVTRGWPEGHVAFHRFGTIIEDLPERSYLRAQQPQFYMAKEVFEETLIQNVIDQASTEKLTVIVTDLFQTDVDVNYITNKIKEKFLSKDQAVGILGIKSEFSGMVYDVGPNNYSFTYKTGQDNPAGFRPFYLLALGSYADISNYFDVALKSGLASFPETNAMILSPYVSQTVASFEGSHITDTQKLQDTSSLLPIDAPSEHVKQFRIPDSSAAKTSFTANLKYTPLSYVMSVNSPELDAEVTAFTCTSAAQSTGAAPLQLTETTAVSRAFTIKDAQLHESAIDFTAEIIPASLPGAGIYSFKTILRPRTYAMPTWVETWNMDSSLVEFWQKSPKDFNGSTTFNLKAFLTNLWENTLRVHRPKVAEFYTYVQKD